ncbi:MAG: hypothetical protein B6I24_07910 [Bacteroidetes bacterium 4572_128]|nr:MAG: hypothetical protein B6I24_07910 [Bacteroidetes bacterium 4572_128]
MFFQTFEVKKKTSNVVFFKMLKFWVIFEKFFFYYYNNMCGENTALRRVFYSYFHTAKVIIFYDKKIFLHFF